MKKKKDSNIEIIELFMAKAGNDWSRCFHGTIKRLTDTDGNPVVVGNIKINDGYVVARARDQWILGEKLDEIVLLVLNFSPHGDVGIYNDCCGSTFFIN